LSREEYSSWMPRLCVHLLLRELPEIRGVSKRTCTRMHGDGDREEDEDEEVCRMNSVDGVPRIPMMNPPRPSGIPESPLM
jgi:hypothetical protein